MMMKKKIIVTVVLISVVVFIVLVSGFEGAWRADAWNGKSQNSVLKYKCDYGLLANKTVSFHYDTEWNWLFGSNQNISITTILVGNEPVDVSFWYNTLDYPAWGFVQLNSTHPMFQQSFVTTAAGSWRLELGAIGTGFNSTSVHATAYASSVLGDYYFFGCLNPSIPVGD